MASSRGPQLEENESHWEITCTRTLFNLVQQVCQKEKRNCKIEYKNSHSIYEGSIFETLGNFVITITY